MVERRISVSDNNKKIGKVMNVSLLPGRDCAKGVPCLKDCYACKAVKAFPTVKPAWGKNGLLFRANMERSFTQIEDELRSKRTLPKRFRWFVAGDFLSQEMVDRAFDLARKFPTVKFLAFTKRYEFDYSEKPANFVLVISTWEGLADTQKDKTLPRSIVVDCHDEIPDGTLECTTKCEKCNYRCWDMKENDTVTFVKH